MALAPALAPARCTAADETEKAGASVNEGPDGPDDENEAVTPDEMAAAKEDGDATSASDGGGPFVPLAPVGAVELLRDRARPLPFPVPDAADA